jgi:hypothetical protein
MTRALIYTLGVCAVSIALEGVFAGSGIKQRLAEIRVPRYALPLWGWIVIGAVYYVTALSCFIGFFPWHNRRHCGHRRWRCWAA